jgi:hypothetical protein
MDSCGIFPLLLHEPKEPYRKISLGTQSSKNLLIFLQSKGGIKDSSQVQTREISLKLLVHDEYLIT